MNLWVSPMQHEAMGSGVSPRSGTPTGPQVTIGASTLQEAYGDIMTAWNQGLDPRKRGKIEALLGLGMAKCHRLRSVEVL